MQAAVFSVEWTHCRFQVGMQDPNLRIPLRQIQMAGSPLLASQSFSSSSSPHTSSSHSPFWHQTSPPDISIEVSRSSGQQLRMSACCTSFALLSSHFPHFPCSSPSLIQVLFHFSSNHILFPDWVLLLTFTPANINRKIGSRPTTRTLPNIMAAALEWSSRLSYGEEGTRCVGAGCGSVAADTGRAVEELANFNCVNWRNHQANLRPSMRGIVGIRVRIWFCSSLKWYFNLNNSFSKESKYNGVVFWMNSCFVLQTLDFKLQEVPTTQHYDIPLLHIPSQLLRLQEHIWASLQLIERIACLAVM